MFVRNFLTTMVIAGLIGAPALAQQPDLNQPLPIDPAVRTGQLENGLRYMIRHNSEPEQRAQIRLVVDAGSVLEDDDQRGLAHFLEHMAFNGTEHFEKQELIAYMESIGMRFGAHVNAYTSFDETVYMLQIPTDSQEIINKAFQILEDWAHLITLDPEEVDKERGVVIEEWRARRGASARIADKQIPLIFKDSKYAERLPIGTVETLESAPPEAIRRFYDDWYRPDLMTVIAVGDFDVDQIEELIREHFSRVPAKADARPRTLVDVPSHDETLYAILSDPEQTNTIIFLLYKQALRDQSTVIAYRQLIVEGLYDQMLNARFFELTQKPDAPILAGFAGQGSFVRSMNVYQLGALVNETGIEQGIEALLIEGERVARHGFTLGELDRAKAEALRGMEQAFAERANRDHRSYADEYVRHTLQGEPIPGIEIEYQLYQGLLPTIELTDVDRMASEWIVDENRVVMVSAPQKEGLTLPSEQVLGMAFSTVMALEIAPYEDTAIDAPLLATIPTGSAVTTTERLEEVDVTVWALENGVRVLLKPTDFKDDEILFRAYSPGGSSLLSDDDFATMFAAAQVVAQGGVGEFSVIDLQKQLAGKAVNVNPNIGDLTEGMSGQASPKDIEAMFQLIYLYFTAPRKDPGVFQAFQAQMQGILANRSASPQAAFADTMQVTMAQGHPRATPISAERVAELDLDRSYEFYQDRFADASDFTFVFVGTFTLEQMQPLVETYLGGLPSIGREETWRDTGVRPPKGVITKAVRKGVEPQSQTTMIFTGPFDYIAENRHSVRSLTAAFQMRMDERLREDLGGTYSPSVTSSYSKDPEWSYTIRVSFGSAPDRVEELTNVVVQEIAKFTNEGPTEEEVTGVREAQRRAKETNLKNNRFWLTNLYFADMQGQDPAYLLDYSLLEGLTMTNIQAAAAKYFDMQNYVVVSLFPEEQVP